MTDLFGRGFLYSDDGYALVAGDFMNLVFQSPLTDNLNEGCTQTSPITDVYDFDSSSYVTLNWTNTGGNTTYQYDLGETRSIRSINCTCAAQGTQSTTYTVKLQGSSDAAAWTDLDTETGAKGSGITIQLALSVADQRYRYVRFYFNSVQAASASSSGFFIYNFGIYI
mgnify:CR=1 FL=1|tara:strand:+ start:8601 stop:9104 length:504 start_codon:yes stop_codon:yes gene_type:complete